MPLDFLRAGDTLVVTRIDHLACSLKDLQDIVHEKARGVAHRSPTGEIPLDRSSPQAAGISRAARARDLAAQVLLQVPARHGQRDRVFCGRSSFIDDLCNASLGNLGRTLHQNFVRLQL